MQSILFWNELSLAMKNELRIIYNNVNRRRSGSKYGGPTLTISKAELHQKKIVLSIWWDYEGVVSAGVELLPNNRTINSDVYCQQLVMLEEGIKEKRPELANCKGIVFHHDSTTPHASLGRRTKLLELGWEVMSHPLYSPDHAPSDYHLFRSLQNFLNGKNFSSVITMTSNLIWPSFLLLRIRNSISTESWSYQKDGKNRSRIEQNGRYLTD